MLTHWTVSPLSIAAVALLAVYELGLHRLNRRSASRRTAREQRAYLFRGGVAVILLASSSPLAYYGMRQLTIHMIGHILLMCFAPAGLVAGGPAVPFCYALPVRARRALLSWLHRSGPGAVLRAVWHFCTRPIVGFLALIAAMGVWHIPRFFDAAMSSNTLHQFGMEPSFLIAGIFFWRSILWSHPYAPNARSRTQAAMVIAVNFEMLVIAMDMSIFSHHPWYSMGPGMAPVPMHGMDMAPIIAAAFAAQQRAAAVLWICGDFWALPALVLIVLRVIKREGSLFAAFDRSFDTDATRDVTERPGAAVTTTGAGAAT